EDLKRIHDERAATEHRLRSLEELDAHHAYYSDTVQQVLSPGQAARINALGKLAVFAEVDAQYEQLIGSLFVRDLQSMLEPATDDGLTGVDFIKTEELARAAFLVLGLHGGEDDFDPSPEIAGPVENRAAKNGGNASNGHGANGIEHWLLD